MRGLKAKTMRRVARASNLPVDRGYKAKVHRIYMPNPLAGKEGQPGFIVVERLQCVLGKCQKQMVNYLKRTCPKGSFFGMSLRSYRGGLVSSPGIINLIEAPKPT